MSEEVKAKNEEVLEEAEGFSEKEKAANRPAEKPRDWVGETVKCFIKDATGIDPTDPISAIAEHFAKNATGELKAKCKAEGKNATGCWRFIEAVARKALGGRSGHIDPGVVYAIAMHYFQDVPKDWNEQPKPKPAATSKTSASTPKAKGKPKKPAETPSEIKKEKAKAKAAAKKAKPKAQQGFFFDLLETPTDTPEKEGEVAE